MIIIKGNVSCSHTVSGNNGCFEYCLSDISHYTDEEWLNLTEEEREKFLEDVLDTEIGNTLACGIDWEEE